MTLSKLLLIFVSLLLTADMQAQGNYYSPAENYGGKQALKELQKLEMVYPVSAIEARDEGDVTLKFTITESGKPDHIQVVESVSESLDKEALRLLNLLLWTPARSKGANMSMEMETTFKFKIKKYRKTVKHRGYDQIEYPFEPVDKSLTIYEPKALDSLPKPIYPNGDMDFSQFIIQNLNYPDAAIRQGISGTVDMFFVVEPSGNFTNYKIENGVGAGCNEEALRLLKLLQWFPGIKNGKAVRTAMKLSITFNIKDSENMKYVPANNANQI